jgi:ketosteroid isomerase-like protein
VTERVEIARRAYAAFQSNGIAGMLPFLDPEIEWRTWERFSREPQLFRGHEGVREVLSVYEENLDALEAEPLEFIEAGDRLVVPFRLRGRAKGSGEEITLDLVHVWGLRGDLAVSLDVYESREEALSATGSAEKAPKSTENSS